MSKILKSSVEPCPGESFYFGDFQPVEPALYPSGGTVFQPMFAVTPVEIIEEQEAPVETPEEPEPEIDIEALLAGMISEEEALQRSNDAYDNGFAEGRRQLEEDFATVSRAFGAAVAELSELREVVLKENESDLLRIAVRLAERIIRKEVTLDRGFLARTVSDILEHLSDQTGLVIRFNPEDYHIIVSNGYLELAGIGDVSRMDIKSDENVAIGGCVVETSSGQIDGQIESQLAELFNQLQEELLTHPSETEHEYGKAALA